MFGAACGLGFRAGEVGTPPRYYSIGFLMKSILGYTPSPVLIIESNH